MTPEEANTLPSLSSELLAYGGIGGVMQTKQERDGAMEKWKADNPERYQEGLRAQERAAAGQQPAQRTQAATKARSGAGGPGGGGASSQNTLLTGAGASQGVDPGALDLSKNTLLGM